MEKVSVQFFSVLLLCLVSLPMCAQKPRRMPVVKANIQQIRMIGQKVHKQEWNFVKSQQLLRNINMSPSKDIIKKSQDEYKKMRQMLEEYEVPKVPPYVDVQNREQLYDSAFISLSMADTLNYIKYLKRSVSAHYPLAMYAYGLSILEGVGVKSNGNIGLSYIKTASESNCPEATFFMAELYEFGNYGYKRDSIMALKLYERSAEQGGFMGKALSGDIYFDRGDTLKAVSYWKSAYEQGQRKILIKQEKEKLAQIAYNLAYFSYYDSQDEIETRNYLKTSAELGHVDGQVWYGSFCMNGYGMEKDSLAAVYWYKQGAQQQHVGAMCTLTFLYYDAHYNDSTILWGTKPKCRDYADIQNIVGLAYYGKEDYEKAETWWKKSAAQKYPDALWWLYWLYEVNKKDSALAFEYLSQAVDAKYPDALHDMACHYANGDMVEKDIEKAKELFLEAASLGTIEAYNNLGNLYIYKGYIKKPNWEIAAKYFQKGAEMNDSDAQYNYGICLKKGKGVKRNKQAAIHWLTLAAQDGNEDAIKELKKLR